MNLFIFVKDKINKTNAAVIIDGPDGEFNSNDENNPIITAALVLFILSLTKINTFTRLKN